LEGNLLEIAKEMSEKLLRSQRGQGNWNEIHWQISYLVEIAKEMSKKLLRIQIGRDKWSNKKIQFE
jgi:hypothetical protein